MSIDPTDADNLVEPAQESAESASEPVESTSDTANLDAVEAPPLEPKELDRYECTSCGYIYEPVKGDGKRRIPTGTPFEELPISWRCPVCGARPVQFANVGPVGAPSGFKGNLQYGFGVNSLTPSQKNLLIFSGLALAVLFFLSLYGMG